MTEKTSWASGSPADWTAAGKDTVTFSNIASIASDYERCINNTASTAIPDHDSSRRGQTSALPLFDLSLD